MLFIVTTIGNGLVNNNTWPGRVLNNAIKFLSVILRVKKAFQKSMLLSDHKNKVKEYKFLTENILRKNAVIQKFHDVK
jgi:hypothetical protein